MVTIPWCTENTRNVMASPASTPSTLWCDNIRVERVWQSKPRVLEKRHWRMEIRKQPTLQNPCSVWPRSPEAWHRNPCFTQQPENLLKTDLQNFAKNAFSSLALFQNSARSRRKGQAWAGILYLQDPLDVCVKVRVQTDLGCQGVGAAHRSYIFQS